MADTALRTADSGYLTRRLIDVSQDVIIRATDCAEDKPAPPGLEFREEPRELGLLETLREQVVGRFLAGPVADPETGEILAETNTMLEDELVDALLAKGVNSFRVRSPMLCGTRSGLCQMCYGRSLATGLIVKMGEAIGIIAAQSIGEPGTQLTMRTFHTGGVAGVGDITSGLPRVEELFEARSPKGQALIAEIDGQVSILREGDLRKIRLSATETFRDEYELPAGSRVSVKDGDLVEEGEVLAQLPAGANGAGANGAGENGAGENGAGENGAGANGADANGDKGDHQLVARVAGRVERRPRARKISILYQHEDVREYAVPAAARLRASEGQQVHAGEQLTEGSVNPQDLLRILGVTAVHRYMIREVQQVYRAQGVNINDKHIEVIVRQMLRKVRIENPGEADFLAGELVDRVQYEELNQWLIADGKQPASAQPVLLGVTKASLSQESWLAAASFQETTRVLTEAAINGSVDGLFGLKENVIIGKLIPARAEIELPALPEPTRPVLEGALPGDLLSEEGMDNLSEDWMQELGFSATEADGEESEEPVAAAAGYVAEPDWDEE